MKLWAGRLLEMHQQTLPVTSGNITRVPDIIEISIARDSGHEEGDILLKREIHSGKSTEE